MRKLWKIMWKKLTDRMTDIEDSSLTQDMEEKRKVKNKITVISEEALQKAHTYVELNFWKNLSHTCGRKKNEPSYVPGNTRRL